MSRKHLVNELHRVQGCALLEDVLLTLGLGINAKDGYTRGHSNRVAIYAVVLARAIDLSEEQVQWVHRAGQLHDLGKLGMPDSILLKPGELTRVEWDRIREHPAIGEQIVRPLLMLSRVLPMIRHHHEQWNGKGYPDGRKGEGISLGARILQIADIFDALTHDRPYRQAIDQATALQILSDGGRNGTSDPDLVKRFVLLVDSGQVAAIIPEQSTQRE
jgi:putative two-component system response regulator